MSEHINRTRKNGRITSACYLCEERVDFPDKGLGRAMLAAWESRHQHPDASRP